MKRWRFLNHELLGCRVEYRGGMYRVTGARRSTRGRGIRFRLLDNFSDREFWTRRRPRFGIIEPPIYPGAIE